jgi:hypothetical protein
MKYDLIQIRAVRSRLVFDRGSLFDFPRSEEKLYNKIEITMPRQVNNTFQCSFFNCRTIGSAEKNTIEAASKRDRLQLYLTIPHWK